MISPGTLQPEWIARASANHKADKILVEKVIRALLLLEGLAQSGLPFVFKGGTAVMLLQQTPRRFSIDIDILVPDKVDFEAALNTFLPDKSFTRVELHTRKAKSTIDKLHYKFFYIPVRQKELAEESVLLDILIEAAPYQNIVPVNINLPFVKQAGQPVTVSIPSKEDSWR
jgi:predicted nucleotidyltransferase component of viral defense system